MFSQYIDPNEKLIEYDTELKNLDVCDRAYVMEYDRRLALRQLKKKNKEPVVEEVTNPEIWLKWKVGDHCRALYAEDNLWYEAKIIAIQGDKCTIHYVGFDENTEMKLNRLDQSLGKKERKRQRAVAKEYLANNGNKTKKGNGAKSKSEIANHHHLHRRRDHCRPNESQIFDGVAENDFKNPHDEAIYPGMPPVNKTKKGSGAKSKSEIASPRHPHQRRDHYRPNENQIFDRVAEDDFKNPHDEAIYPGMPPVNKTTKGNDAKSKSEIASPHHRRDRPNETQIFNGFAENDYNNPHTAAIYPRMLPVNKTKKANGAKSKSEIASPHHTRDHYRPNETQIFNGFAENDFNNPHEAIYPGMPPVNKTTKGNDAKSKSEIASPHHRRDHYRPNETQIFNGFAENDFNNPHTPAIYPRMPPVAIPAALPMLELPNFSSYAMLTSWYMAGYYTGLNQAQKDSFQQHCCCQNCC